MPHQVYIASIADNRTNELEEYFLEKGEYEVSVYHNGGDLKKQLEHKIPDYLFLDLLLPNIHSLSLLQKLAQDHPDLSIFVYTAKSMEQDYIESLNAGAAYYIHKAYSIETIDQIFNDYQKGSLSPPSYNESLSPFSNLDEIFHSEFEHKSIDKAPPPLSIEAPKSLDYIKFWGTRGSVPVSGYEHLLYGGNTSCLEVRAGGQLIIIDAGTGIRALSKTLIGGEDAVKDIHLFISHTHWDHILGFPFFAPAYFKGRKIHIYAPKGSRGAIREIFTGILAREYFPVALDEMAANFEFHEVDHTSSVEIGSINLDFLWSNHPGPCISFRIRTKNMAIGYATDNEIFGGYLGNPNELKPGHPIYESYLPMIHFFSDCDWLIHEAQYSTEQYKRRIGWGHSSVNNATALAKLCKPQKWIITHHDPEATDQTLTNKLHLHKALLAECDAELDLSMAHDYMLIGL